MRKMLVSVRGGDQALREKPLAIFDCCPTAPLSWSELTCDVLVECGRSGIVAELVSVPMTGATAPATLLGALVQHTAENLSGVVIHQLAAPGSPLVYGGCPAAFDMRHGTAPMGAIETMMLDAGHAQMGRHLGLPTHGYLALSDSKTLDYQAGLETGLGALFAALSGIDVVSGAGMLELVGCQSLEKLVLDQEPCAMAKRARAGIAKRGDSRALDVIAQGTKDGQFLKLKDTRRWFRKELHFPGPTIDRQGADAWTAAGNKTSADRAHEVVETILGEPETTPLQAPLVQSLRDLIPS
jgi:trimethylamine--corrinoid protein Co-methyltransferase